MSAIQLFLSALRRLANRLHIGVPTRWLFLLFSAVCRLGVLKRNSMDMESPKNSQAPECVEDHPTSNDSEHRNARPANYFSASFMPTALHPYRFAGPSTSRLSQDIGTLPIPDSYLLGNLSAQNLSSQPPSLRTRSPSPISLTVPTDESPDIPETAEKLSRRLSEADHSGRLCPRTPEDIADGRYKKQVPM